LINCGNVGCTADLGADPSQSVAVTAGNKFRELEIAASIAIGGTAGVGVGVGVGVVNLNTDAFIASSAKVYAAKDIKISATGEDGVIGGVAGVGGGGGGRGGRAG